MKPADPAKPVKERPKPIGFWQGHDEGDITADSGPSAWSDNRYKLVKPAPNKYELYDLTADLAEKKNLAAELPEIVSRMKAELEAWLESVLRSYRGEDYPDKQAAPDSIQKAPKPVPARS